MFWQFCFAIKWSKIIAIAYSIGVTEMSLQWNTEDCLEPPQLLPMQPVH